uniref:Retrovirus-related Pol polyprotein from transposon TNT 1-94 n=1 Tax=Cajanus cajan TaxID=3821 RepID=A0A151SYQ1_CAJCA|nr:Retrovirus-related Pol polyprotein from transposon TNT 1-94 [Cajanus cajan]
MLIGRIRSLHLQSGLPKHFWVEIISTTTYLINQGPQVPLEHEISKARWSRKEIKVSHLKVFSCAAHVHISD